MYYCDKHGKWINGILTIKPNLYQKKELISLSILVMATTIHSPISASFPSSPFHLFCIFHPVPSPAAFIYNIFLTRVPFPSPPRPLPSSQSSSLHSWNRAIIWLQFESWRFFCHTAASVIFLNHKPGHGTLLSKNLYCSSDATKSSSNSVAEDDSHDAINMVWLYGIIHCFSLLNTFGPLRLKEPPYVCPSVCSSPLDEFIHHLILNSSDTPSQGHSPKSQEEFLCVSMCTHRVLSMDLLIQCYGCSQQTLMLAENPVKGDGTVYETFIKLCLMGRTEYVQQFETTHRGY